MKYIKLYESFSEDYLKRLNSLNDFVKDSKKELQNCLMHLIDSGYRVEVQGPPQHKYLIVTINTDMDPNNLLNIVKELEDQIKSIQINMNSVVEVLSVVIRSYIYSSIILDGTYTKDLVNQFGNLLLKYNVKDLIKMKYDRLEIILTVK